MLLWRWSLLKVYYWSTLPLRQARDWTRVRSGRAPITVVLFHRITDDRANGWTTPTGTFIKGIRWLRANFELVSLEEAQRRIRQPVNHRPCVAVTFDDGYACNCDVALPLLAERGIPCTYFVTTQNVLKGRPFDHDLAMGNRFQPNTIDQLRELAERGIEIGSHTRTHANLGRITDRHELYDEIVVARDELQDAVGHPVRRFAAPFGLHKHLQPEALQLCYDAGFECFASAYGGYNYPGGDPFHVQRTSVDGSFLRLKNRATVDPVKEIRVRRFHYDLQANGTGLGGGNGNGKQPHRRRALMSE